MTDPDDKQYPAHEYLDNLDIETHAERNEPIKLDWLKVTEICSEFKTIQAELTEAQSLLAKVCVLEPNEPAQKGDIVKGQSAWDSSA